MKSSFYVDHVFKAQSHSEILEVEALPWLCLNVSPNSGTAPQATWLKGLGTGAHSPWQEDCTLSASRPSPSHLLSPPLLSAASLLTLLSPSRFPLWSAEQNRRVLNLWGSFSRCFPSAFLILEANMVHILFQAQKAHV